MRHAIAQIQRDGGVVQQSDNPGTTYQDQWWVDLTQARLDDNVLLRLASDLRKVPKLWLTLSSCPISDHGLSGLADVKNLVWLDLDGTQITDSGLPHLSELSRLERLDLSRTRVSDKGLHNLSKLANLETLLLHHTAVTESSVQELHKLLPKCHINYDDEH
jgi:internalin A